ncbi:MAG TPA: hypothetical protein VL443_24510 [Cyclobacteriaceae bacterium]|jgi:hypothetical protein|nr:hypothetical protein [Cyclobacteriaceae bacterium]
MKTLTILFESPNVFYAFIDGVNIRIDNPEILNATLKWRGAPNEFAYTNQYGLKNGQTFQVEGFEYEVKEICSQCEPKYNEYCTNYDHICMGEYKKVAILKLAKEEEPKEQILRKPLRSDYSEDSDLWDYMEALENYIEQIEKLKK